MAYNFWWIAFAAIMLVLSGTWNSLVSKSFGKILAPGLHNESEKVCTMVVWGKESVIDLKETMVCKGVVSFKDPLPAPFQNPLWQVLAMFMGMASNLVLHSLTSNSKDPPLPKAAIYGFLAPTVFSMLVSLHNR
jgi:hypothetical protein